MPSGTQTAPGGAPTAPTLPGGAASSQGISGTWRLQGGDAVLTLEQDASGAIRGTMAGSGGSFTV